MKPISSLVTTIKSHEDCPDCGKNCLTKRGCIITQLQTEINKERGKLKPVKFVTIMIKLQGIPEDDIAYCLSNCKDYKNRKGSFSKCFWGSLKIKK